MIHIVYIDSEPRNHFAMDQYAIILRERGFDNTLKCFSSGTEALYALAEAPRPTIILAALDLQDMTGQTIVRRLRQLPNLAEVPIIGLKPGTMPLDQESRKAGCDKLLVKPLRYQAVEDVLKQYTARA
jgi:CheY-like chemotaxis protein